MVRDRAQIASSPPHVVFDLVLDFGCSSFGQVP